MRATVRWAVGAIVVAHGLIHLMGAAKGLGWSSVPQLTEPISAAMGSVWLLAAVLVVAAGVLMIVRYPPWWAVAAAAAVVSQVAIVTSWSDAKAGTLANVVLIAAAAYGFRSQGPTSYRAEISSRSLRARHDQVVCAAFAAHPLKPAAAPLMAGDLTGLPDPVRRYVTRSGALGRPRPQNMCVVMDANMYRKPGQAPMHARSVQYTFFGQPTRLFLMEARMFGLPVRALHVYRRAQATFTVRVASTVTIVDQHGEQISAAETVTVLNDLCLMAPGALLDPRLAWSAVDDRSATVTFTNGPHVVSATLVFNDRDELVDFWSDDRPDSSGGTFIPLRWSTPVTAYRDGDDGRHLIHRGAAVYHRPDGPFTYGDFTIRSIQYDLPGPMPTGRRLPVGHREPRTGDAEAPIEG